MSKNTYICINEYKDFNRGDICTIMRITETDDFSLICINKVVISTIDYSLINKYFCTTQELRDMKLKKILD